MPKFSVVVCDKRVRFYKKTFEAENEDSANDMAMSEEWTIIDGWMELADEYVAGCYVDHITELDEEAE